MPARNQHLAGVFADGKLANLSSIQLWRRAIESFGMDVFELRGIDAPLIRGDLQPIKNGR